MSEETKNRKEIFSCDIPFDSATEANDLLTKIIQKFGGIEGVHIEGRVTKTVSDIMRYLSMVKSLTVDYALGPVTPKRKYQREESLFDSLLRKMYGGLPNRKERKDRRLPK